MLFITEDTAKELKLKIGEVLKSFDEKQIDKKEKAHLFRLFIYDIDFNTKQKDNLEEKNERQNL